MQVSPTLDGERARFSAQQKGQRFDNSEGFLKLKREVEKLSMMRVQIVYYKVAKEENVLADALAKAGVRG